MTSEFIVDVSDADFEMAVLDRSIDVPVLLDCWAPWCGPCKSLTPILEKLAAEYNGRFILAKLNTDESPQVAAALRVRSIPMVTLISGGRPVDQFMGALPEGQVRAFLDKHLPPAGDEAGGEPPPDPLDEAAALIEEGAIDDAEMLLAQFPPEARNDRHAALLKRIDLARSRPPGDKAELEARIAKNAKDFEARFALAAIQASEGDFKSAFDSLLDVVLRDKAEHREKARLQLVEWFDLCTDPDTVSYGRRYLGMYLN